MSINTASFSQIPENERAAMIERFKTASSENRVVMHKQFEVFKDAKDQIILQQLEACSKNNKITK